MTTTERSADHVDVLIVGAGLSGIGAGYHLQAECPQKTYAILEARESIGGTWDLFRYPGVRSDSDMYTLGYRFRPWPDAKAIADGPSILQYVRDTAGEHGIDRKIRFGHRVVRAEWSTESARWTVEAERSDTGETVRLTCGFSAAVHRLLPLRPWLRARVRGPRALPRPDRPPAALARGHRLRGQAGRGDRQRRDRRDPRPGDGEERGARDDAAALAELHRRPAGRGSGRPRASPPAGPADLCVAALEERPADAAELPAQPPSAASSSRS